MAEIVNLAAESPVSSLVLHRASESACPLLERACTHAACFRVGDRTNVDRERKRERGREKLVHQLPPLPLPPPSLEDLNYFNSSEIAVLTREGEGAVHKPAGCRSPRGTVAVKVDAKQPLLPLWLNSLSLSRGFCAFVQRYTTGRVINNILARVKRSCFFRLARAKIAKFEWPRMLAATKRNKSLWERKAGASVPPRALFPCRSLLPSLLFFFFFFFFFSSLCPNRAT